jgi:subtilisin
MVTKKIAFFLIFSALLGWATFAHAAEKDNRYFVSSTSNFWKNTLGTRNTFSDGFTADLTDWQIRLTKIFGVEIIPVKKLYVLQDKESKTILDNVSGLLDDLFGEDQYKPSASVPWGVAAVYGSDKKPSGGKDIKVAVLDTGVFKDHSDLSGRIGGCLDFTQSKKSVIENECEDKNGHGTHVAGVIGADGGKDGLGIYGIAPEVQLHVYKVCDADGICWSDDVAAALRHAGDNGIHIVNLGFGSDVSSSLVSEALDYVREKKMLIVAPAGNDGPYDGSIDYPAWVPSVISVGAFDATKVIPEWSSRGNNDKSNPVTFDVKDLQFVAPGVNIESTWKDGNYAILSGSSMAAPHVAGLAAKIWQLDNENPVENVISVLKKLSKNFGEPGDDNASGLGFPSL